MRNNTNKALKLGVLVTVALLLFLIAIYLIGSKNNLFNSTTIVKCSFRDIRGIIVGNNVRFSGINVGNVKNIELVSDSSVILDLSIKDDYTKFIYKNSVAEISQEGVMGDKLITISSGTPESGPIKEGDFLRAKEGIDIESMLVDTREILYQARDAVNSLKSVAQKINEGKGDLGIMINDNSITTKLNATTERLNSTLTNVNQITDKINKGQGDLGKLINNDNITTETTQILNSLKQTGQKADNVVSAFEITANAINQGDGVAYKFIHDKKMSLRMDTTVTKVNSGVDQFILTAKAIEDSWLIRLFTKKKKNKEPTPPTDTIK